MKKFCQIVYFLKSELILQIPLEIQFKLLIENKTIKIILSSYEHIEKSVKYTLLYFKWITNKDLLYSTGNTARYYVAAWMGGEFGG